MKDGEVMDIEEYSVAELQDLIEYASDLLLAKKHPQQAMRRNNILQDVKMCYSKIWFQSLRLANKRAKNLTNKFKVEYRVYECPNCGGYHLTTQLAPPQPNPHKEQQ